MILSIILHTVELTFISVSPSYYKFEIDHFGLKAVLFKNRMSLSIILHNVC